MIATILADVAGAAEQTFSPGFRAILLKSVAASLVLLALVWFGLDWLIVTHAAAAPVWTRLPLAVLAGVGFAFCAAYLLAPISALVAGFYADDMAELVERRIDPARVGARLGLGAALGAGLRFCGLAILVNALALCLLFVPGVNLVAFLGANSYLLGRASFELAALRHVGAAEALALYRRHAGYVFLCSLAIGLLLMVPVLNLVTPLFAVALMTRTFARVADPFARKAARADEAALS